MVRSPLMSADRSPLSALTPSLTPEQGVSGTFSISENDGEEGSSSQLESAAAMRSRVDPKAFNRLSQRFVESRKENAKLKDIIAAQNETMADSQEHVRKLQSELKVRIDSEALGLRQIRDLQSLIESKQRQHDAEVAKLHEKLAQVSETVQEGFKQNEDEYQMESKMLEELHRQLLGAGKVIAGLKRRIEDVNTANDALKESEARLEAKIDVLEEQKNLAKQQIQEEAAKAYDAQKKMRLSQEQLAKVIVRSENASEAQDEMYQSVKASVLQISKENDSLKAKMHVLESERELLKNDLLNSRVITQGISVAVQTVEKASKRRGKSFYAEHWNPWVWLTTLSLIDENAGDPLYTIGTQTEAEDVPITAVEMRTKSTPDGVTVSVRDRGMNTEDWEAPEKKGGRKKDVNQYDVWFASLLQKAEDLMPHIHLKKTLQMTANQLFAEISDIYSRKAVADEVDDREGFPRQRLGEFIHMSYLEKMGEVQLAEQAFYKLLVNVLAHIRGIRFTTNAPTGYSSMLSPQKSPQKGRLAGMTNREESTEVHIRVILFARFLGIRHENKLALPLAALNVYISSLMEMKKGQLPLLPTHAERILVKQSEYVQVLDWIFGHSRAIVRSRIKTELIDMNGDWDTIDLEVALDFTINAWKGVTEKWEARLQSLFTTADTDANGNLEYVEFEEMMEKLRVDEPNLPSERRRLRMYQEMALHENVDNVTFIRVAKMYDLCKFTVGRPYAKILHRNSPEDETLFQALEGHVAGLEHAVESTLAEIDESGKSSRGLGQRWFILQDMLKERRRVSIAYAFFSQITQAYASIARMARVNAPSKPPDSPNTSPNASKYKNSPRGRSQSISPAGRNARNSVSPLRQSITNRAQPKLESAAKKLMMMTRFQKPATPSDGKSSPGNLSPMLGRRKGDTKKSAETAQEGEETAKSKSSLTVKTDEKHLGERPDSDLDTDDDADSDTSSNVSRAGGAVKKDEMDGLAIPKAPQEEVDLKAGEAVKEALKQSGAPMAGAAPRRRGSPAEVRFG